MNKLVIVSVGALMLAGCTVREQQLATAGVAGAIVGSALTAPAPQPVYVQQRYEQHYIPVPSRRPRCYAYWENTRRGYVERTVCGNHIP